MSDTPRTDSVICPGCCHQFVAVPIDVQQQLTTLREALTSERLVKEIAMQVRHYEPISEENVRELLDDIRQGIAIYLDEAGLAETEPHNQCHSEKP